jgi:hypothetical protein
MFRQITILLSCLLLAACGAKGEKGLWRASVERGDKPGLGMELSREPKGLVGAIYIMNPDKPGDFSVAQRYPIEVQRERPQDVFFVVFFAPHQPDRVLLKLNGPIAGPHFHAVMQSADGRGDPIDFDFERVK